MDPTNPDKNPTWSCECCQIARHHPAYAMFTPRCIHCGARLIQRIGRLSIPPSEITARRRRVLADWMAYGHPEQEIRALAKSGSMALGPEPSTESESPNPKKRR